jgi:hypothetical protein
MRAKFLQDIIDETPFCVDYKVMKWAEKLKQNNMEKEKIKWKLNLHTSKIKEITTDKNQFQRNVESETWYYWLSKAFQNIERHESYIDKTVNPRKDSFDYVDELMYCEQVVNSLNKFTEKILYTQELHNAFLVNYKLWLIERLQSYNEERFFNSTSLIHNCVDLWEFEQRKEIIKFLKGL